MVAPTPLVGGQTLQTLQATVYNETPQPATNSQFSSFQLFVPTTGASLTITGFTKIPGATVSISADKKSISVTKLGNVQPGQSQMVEFTVTAGSANADCSPAQGDWTAAVFTGSQLNGDSFVKRTTSVNWMPTTTVAANCILQFLSQPADAMVGVLITNTPYNLPANDQPVQVRALINGVVSTASGLGISLSSSCTTLGLTLSGAGATTTSGVAAFGSLSSSSPGAGCTLTASATNYVSAQSNTFKVTTNDGQLVCAGQEDPNANPPTHSTFNDGTGSVSGGRGRFNKDGSTCVAVPYDATGLAVPADKVVNFKWDTVTQPNAAFEYTVAWNPTAVDATTGMPPARRTKVAWETGKYGVSGEDYVYGVACLSPNLPAPYATLSSFTTAPDTITVAVPVSLPTGWAAIPTSGSFALAIGTERMTATYSGSPGVYNVVRSNGANGTTPVDLSLFVNKFVMSTPLPIDNNPNMAPPNTAKVNPYLGKQAQMCIQDEGFTSLTPGFVQFTTTIFDIGDGWVSFD